MRYRFNNVSKYLIAHGFLAHEIHVLAAAIIIHMVQAMGVGKSSSIHFYVSSFLVHVAYELPIVIFYALVVFGKIDASNFYLNASNVTLCHGFVA